jgi:hypothetical protein
LRPVLRHVAYQESVRGCLLEPLDIGEILEAAGGALAPDESGAADEIDLDVAKRAAHPSRPSNTYGSGGCEAAPSAEAARPAQADRPRSGEGSEAGGVPRCFQ